MHKLPYSLASAVYALLIATAAPCWADECSTPSDEHGCVQDAGRLRGVVSQIDYRRGSVIILTPDHRRLHVLISPTTSVAGGERGGDDYHAITDITVGTPLTINASRHGHTYEAQSVEIESR